MAVINKRSPNQNNRPRGGRPRAIVIHATAGKDSLGHLRNPAPDGKPENAVSAHDLIAKNGDRFHLVDYPKRAWHAGNSLIPGLVGDVNDLSIGIEIENINDGFDPYPEAQMETVIRLVRDLVEEFNIPRQFVVRHRDIALPRGRKSDPAPPAFAWNEFLDAVFNEGARQALNATSFVVLRRGVRIRQGPGTDFAEVGEVNTGDVIAVDRLAEGESIEGENRWGHLADNRGFVTMAFLRAR